MKIWVTKYTLSQGILEIDAEPCHIESMISYKTSSCKIQFFHGEGKEWHRTKNAAVVRAEEMRIAKLKSLDKQMKKVAALKFN